MGGCVFHAMENISGVFPRYGKLFSTVWKIRIDQNRRNGLGTRHTHAILFSDRERKRVQLLS